MSPSLPLRSAQGFGSGSNLYLPAAPGLKRLLLSVDRLYHRPDLFPLRPERTCIWGTPMLTVMEGIYLAGRLGEHPRRERLLKLCLEWLCQPVPGAATLKIMGRAYTQEEAARVFMDTLAAADLPCPFKQGGLCLLGSYQPLQCRVGYEAGPDLNPLTDLVKRAPQGWRLYAFLPALLAVAWSREAVATLVRGGEVADVKLARQVSRRERQIEKMGLVRARSFETACQHAPEEGGLQIRKDLGLDAEEDPAIYR